MSAFRARPGAGTCATGGQIDPGQTYGCSFTETLDGGNVGPNRHFNIVTASVIDGASDTAWDSDIEMVQLQRQRGSEGNGNGFGGGSCHRRC